MRVKPTRRDVRNGLRAWSAVAVDRGKAARSDAALGVDAPERERKKPVQREASEQVELFKWVSRAQAKHPELSLLLHVPNGGRRDAISGARLKAQGVRAGVPDLLLPVPRQGWAGLWIELKAGRGKVSDVQSAWIDNLRGQGYRVEVCRGWEAAKRTLEEYLT